jgi:hypothetical protein
LSNALKMMKFMIDYESVTGCFRTSDTVPAG